MKRENRKFVFGGVAGAAVSTFAWLVFVGNPDQVVTVEGDVNPAAQGQEIAATPKQSPVKFEDDTLRPENSDSISTLSDPSGSSENNSPPHEEADMGTQVELATEVEVAAELETAVDVSVDKVASSAPKQAESSALPSSMATTMAKSRLPAADRAPGANFRHAPTSREASAQVVPIPLPKPIDTLPANGYSEEGRDQFESLAENDVKLATEHPVSTFSVDVDTASYSFVRSALSRGVLPQKNAVRIEEMVNYFDYDYPLPGSRFQPFKPTVAVVDSPWAKEKKLIHIGIKGYDLAENTRRKVNIIFLLDVSGSMKAADKLPLVKQSLSMLLNVLKPSDRVGIVVYAGAAGAVLEPTPVSEKQKIIDAMNRLQAGGSTAGGEGIKLAYQLAEANFDKAAVNRIILATDGDFNVGIRNREELKGFIERKREKGIFLSVLGFGRGNYNDHLMQSLAQNGNGMAAYIDTLGEAQKVLVNEATSTLFPIAKDVKLQFEFNPATVVEYRLIGYETRRLQREDFNNDKVDAGDIGAGHTVTAIYEITPRGSSQRLVDDRRYDSKAPVVGRDDEYGFLKIRYKLPEADKSQLITHTVGVENQQNKLSTALQREINFASAVAGFAQLLKTSKYVGDWSYDKAIELAQSNKGADEFGYRTEFVQLIRKAKVAEAM
ncbi:MAG: VWA domain-containing protein [Cellvibrionaceae bacterium]|nr:VWA domain-containing protein [Cellvibrionaceae bacterium]